MNARIDRALRTLRNGWMAALASGLVVVFASSALHAAPQRPSDLDGARERWKQFSPEQREELRRRFEHFKRLGEDERATLRGRFEHLGLVKRRAVEELPESVRRDLEALAPPARREVLREVAAERLSEHVRDVLELLPPHIRAEYDGATADERLRIVRDFARQLNERARHELLRLGRELQLDPARVEAIAKLEPHELGRKVLELKRESIERRVAEHGLPPFITNEQWTQLRTLQGHEFFRQWGALHGAHAPHDRAGPGGERRPGGGFGPGEGPGGREGAGPPPRPEPKAERGGERNGGSRDLSPRAERLRAMREAVRPDPAWFVELSRVDPNERRRVIGERLRERALKFLAGAPELVSAQQLEQLRKESGGRFHEALKRLLPDLGEPPVLRGGERGHERGPERGPPHGPDRGPDRGPRFDRPAGDGPPKEAPARRLDPGKHPERLPGRGDHP